MTRPQTLRLFSLVACFFAAFAQQEKNVVSLLETVVPKEPNSTITDNGNNSTTTSDFSTFEGNEITEYAGCVETTVDKRSGPIYVAFELPLGQEGSQIDYNAGRAYKDVGNTCFILAWSDHSFVCTDGEWLKTAGGWPVSLLLPSDCVDGGGAIENGVQDHLVVSHSMHTTCSAENINVHNDPLHVQFDLPGDTYALVSVDYTAGRIGRQVDGVCKQIEWTDLEFVCDSETISWNLVNGAWNTQDAATCEDSWSQDTILFNARQDNMHVLDTLDTPSCPAVDVTREQGPLEAVFQLPTDVELNSTVSFQEGSVTRKYNDTCYTVQWASHEYTCEIFSQKWILTSGSVDFMAPLILSECSVGETNVDQPFLQIIDHTLDDPDVLPVEATNVPTETFTEQPSDSAGSTQDPSEGSTATQASNILTSSPSDEVSQDIVTPAPSSAPTKKTLATPPTPILADKIVYDSFEPTAAPVPSAPVPSAPVASPVAAPTTAAPVVAAPTTAAPVVAAPTTAAPVVAAPTTASPTSAADFSAPAFSLSGFYPTPTSSPVTAPTVSINSTNSSPTPNTANAPTSFLHNATDSPPQNVTTSFPTAATTTSAPINVINSSSSSPSTNATTSAPTAATTRYPTKAPTATNSPTKAPVSASPSLADSVTSVERANETPLPSVAPVSTTSLYTGKNNNLCGCVDCTTEVWSTIADTFTCGARIEYLVNSGLPLADACQRVGGDEFPDLCGSCVCKSTFLGDATGGTRGPTPGPTEAASVLVTNEATDEFLLETDSTIIPSTDGSPSGSPSNAPTTFDELLPAISDSGTIPPNLRVPPQAVSAANNIIMDARGGIANLLINLVFSIVAMTAVINLM